MRNDEVRHQPVFTPRWIIDEMVRPLAPDQRGEVDPSSGTAHWLIAVQQRITEEA